MSDRKLTVTEVDRRNAKIEVNLVAPKTVVSAVVEYLKPYARCPSAPRPDFPTARTRTAIGRSDGRRWLAASGAPGRSPPRPRIAPRPSGSSPAT